MKKKHLKIIKNKYIIATALFVLYAFFLDDNDIFNILDKNRIYKANLSKIEFNKNELTEIKEELEAVNDLRELERIAREDKYFKKDNEDVFVVVRE